MTLKIQVKETIRVFDTVDDLKREINRIIDDYVMSDDREPLIITIIKEEGRGPPVLSISVKDEMNISETLGG